MHTAQTNKFPRLPLLVGGIAAILISGIALASLAISAQGFSGAVAPTEAPEVAALPAIAVPAARFFRCPECGVIESTREITGSGENIAVKSSGRTAASSRGGIDAKPLRNTEITIRLRDGSMRVITDAKPAKWRHGEPVTVIAGVD